MHATVINNTSAYWLILIITVTLSHLNIIADIHNYLKNRRTMYPHILMDLSHAWKINSMHGKYTARKAKHNSTTITLQYFTCLIGLSGCTKERLMFVWDYYHQYTIFLKLTPVNKPWHFDCSVCSVFHKHMVNIANTVQPIGSQLTLIFVLLHSIKLRFLSHILFMETGKTQHLCLSLIPLLVKRPWPLK